AGELDRVHRRLVGRHLDQRLQAAEPLEIFVVELLLAGVERGGEAAAVARGLRRQLDALGAGLAKQQGLVAALDDLAQFRERHRLVVDIDLAEIDQPLHEAAQTIFVEVDAGGHFAFLTSFFLLGASAPSPCRGEGWGEGLYDYRESERPSPGSLRS